MHIRHDDERLSAFLDDELSDHEALAVTRHLRACAPCRDDLEQLRQARTALRSLSPVEVPLSFMVESVLLGPHDDHRPHSVVALGLVVAVSVLLVTAFALGGPTGGVAPDVESLVGDHVRSVGGGPVVVPVMLDG